jgi:hypothetical protein
MKKLIDDKNLFYSFWTSPHEWNICDYAGSCSFFKIPGLFYEICRKCNLRDYKKSQKLLDSWHARETNLVKKITN